MLKARQQSDPTLSQPLENWVDSNTLVGRATPYSNVAVLELAVYPATTSYSFESIAQQEHPGPRYNNVHLIVRRCRARSGIEKSPVWKLRVLSCSHAFRSFIQPRDQCRDICFLVMRLLGGEPGDDSSHTDYQGVPPSKDWYGAACNFLDPPGALRNRQEGDTKSQLQSIFKAREAGIR